MAKSPVLDRFGRPIDRMVLQEEISAPTLTGVRSPLTGYPADGLTPDRLAAILREADSGDPLRFLELAETIEERDLHYLGVLGTRRRGVAQIEITVEAASDAPEDVAKADMVRNWLKRDELEDDLFNILDCIGKGYSFTEIIWDTSEGQWEPGRLEWRDPRWFRFALHDLTTPLMLDDFGERVPLPPFKFINARMSAKSGLPIRSGIARIAAWAWMFKAYTQRDWAIFTQTYGQPLRVGKWGPGATEDDKNTLFRAVANIAGDCAAIIPETMSIDFVEMKSANANSDLYKGRADWLDQQVSKGVLGQTTTTDAISGGHAIGREHRLVQKDISRADGKALAAIINRDLVRPWMDLEFGPQKRYPKVKIEEAEDSDLQLLATAVGTLVPAGLRIKASEMRGRMGFSDPQPGDELIGGPVSPPAPPPSLPASAPKSPAGGPAVEPSGRTSPIKHFSGEIKRGADGLGIDPALNAEGPSAANSGAADYAAEIAAQIDAGVALFNTSRLPSTVNSGAADHAAEIAAQIERDAQPKVGDMVAQIEAMLGSAGSLDEFRAMLLAAFPKIDASGVAAAMAQGLMAAQAAGRAAVEEEAGD